MKKWLVILTTALLVSTLMCSCTKKETYSEEFFDTFARDFVAVGYKEHDPDLVEKYTPYMTDAPLNKLHSVIDGQWKITRDNTAGEFDKLAPIIDTLRVFPSEIEKGDQRVMCEGTFHTEFDSKPIYFRIELVITDGKITKWEDSYYETTKPQNPSYDF